MDFCSIFKKNDVDCSLFGSLNGYPYYPIVVERNSDIEFTAEAFLRVVGAHEEMISSVHVVHEGELTEIANEHALWLRGGDEMEPGKYGKEYLFCNYNDRSFRITDKVFEAITTPDDNGNKPFPLIFHCGLGKLNPVPVFIVGRMASNIVGGFLSATVYISDYF